MSFNSIIYIALIWMIGFNVCQAEAVLVTMKSGERVIGEVLPESDESTLVLKSNLLGEVRLPTSQISKREAHGVVATEVEKTVGEDSKAVVGKKAPAKKLEFTREEMEYVDEPSFFERISRLKTPDSWSGNLRFGLDHGSGNSDWRQLYSKGNLVIDPKKSPNYYRLTGSYTYRTTEKDGETVKSTDRYDGNFTYRRDIIGSLFFQNSIAGRVDRIKGINHEVQELMGLGFRIEAFEDLELILGGSGGVEDFDAEYEDERSGVHAVANAFQELKWTPFEKATFAQEFNYFLEPGEEYKYNYVFTASFRYRLTDLLGFEVSFDKNFDSDVGNGNVRDDTRWRNAIIVYF